MSFSASSSDLEERRRRSVSPSPEDVEASSEASESSLETVERESDEKEASGTSEVVEEVEGETSPESTEPTEKPKETPPEAPQKSTPWGLSWSSIMDTVKKQSEAVLDVYKRDLTEFVQVVSEETSHLSEKLKPVMETTKETVKAVIFEDSDEDDEPTELERAIEEGVERAATAVSKVALNVQGNLKERAAKLAPRIEGIAKSINVEGFAKSINVEKAKDKLSDLLSQAVMLKPSEEELRRKQQQANKKLVFDRKQALVLNLRSNPDTFLQDPSQSSSTSRGTSMDIDGLQQRYHAFHSSFNIAQHAAQISRMLNEDEELKRMMRRMVPSKMEYETFWVRYFFKVSEIEVEEERRREMVKNATLEDEEFAWGSESEESEKAEDTKDDEKSAKSSESEPKEPLEKSKVVPQPDKTEEDDWDWENDLATSSSDDELTEKVNELKV